MALLFWLLATGLTGYIIYDLMTSRFGDGASLVVTKDMKPPSLWDDSGAVVVALGFPAFICLLVAILYTVMLVFAARRATLRQVNANLMEISQQLKQLQQSLASQAARQPVSGG
ncbi:hypothetical protein AYO44_08450 [Planctomycetaceae bacterium SCGC AG-212-F19]|nr:hypothetical protein AYO44_08450 [Planctomycetaceae bacterium SCGC AG-212-F19]